MNIATILNLPLMFLSPFLLEKVGRRPLVLIASFGYIILPIIGFVGKMLSNSMGPNGISVILGAIIIFMKLIIKYYLLYYLKRKCM